MSLFSINMEAKTTNSTTDIKVALTSLKNSTVKIKAPSGMIVILDDVDIDYSYDEIELTSNGNKIKYKGNSYTKISIEKFNDQEQVNVSNKVINHNYRGKISFFVQNSQIVPVNEVPLEEYLYGVLPGEIGRFDTSLIACAEYLYGVLPGEIGTSFPEEALKAQAVISRSYVLFSKKNNKNVNFDVYDSVMSQVYLGYDYESKKLNMIVDSTKDKVITYNEKIINAVFHSDSGGKTVNNEDAWGGQPLPYLRGRDDNNSDYSPKKKWDLEISYKEIISKFGIEPKEIFVAYNNADRVEEIVFNDTKTTKSITGDKFRIALGNNRIFSNYMEIENDKKNERLLITGRGFGHGVGASQWGMYNLAKKGYNYQKIIKFYYQNVKIEDEQDVIF